MTAKIEIVYTCGTCPVQDVKVAVDERTPAQDVVQWMRETVMPAVRIDHIQRAPFCEATSVTKLMIPKPIGTDRVGDVVKN